MWFDPQTALKQLGGGDMPPPDPATRPEPKPFVAQVARVARPHPLKPQMQKGTEAPRHLADGMFSNYIKRAGPIQSAPQTDTEAYLAALTLHGPMTYGAAAMALRWGATRAWLAEAALVAEGLASVTREGRAYPCARA